jgi:hypothetical protein
MNLSESRSLEDENENDDDYDKARCVAVRFMESLQFLQSAWGPGTAKKHSPADFAAKERRERKEEMEK